MEIRNTKTLENVQSPCYVMEEDLLRRNLALIHRVAEESGAEIILAFKAFALWKTFPIFRSYIQHTTASSPYEARLAYEEFGSRAHAYSPAYEEKSFDTILTCCSHLTFNSLSQLHQFMPRVREWDASHPEASVSVGIRINPEYSEIETDLYNPCAPGTRFGILADDLDRIPDGVEGFHCHCHCESDSYALERTLKHVEERFGKWLPSLKWLNLGGGHLMTREGYDVEHLIRTLRALKERYPNLSIYLEPGSAFAWQTGTLVAEVVDVVCNKQIKTAILNVSFTCHMPDCLEMPYMPVVRGARIVSPEEQGLHTAPTVYRLGGNSCLSGDFLGYWEFPSTLHVGQRIIFEDMIHYTTVKTTMFNGIQHPSIALLRSDGSVEYLRHFAYEDYRDRMC